MDYLKKLLSPPECYVAYTSAQPQDTGVTAGSSGANTRHATWSALKLTLKPPRRAYTMAYTVSISTYYLAGALALCHITLSSASVGGAW